MMLAIFATYNCSIFNRQLWHGDDRGSPRRWNFVIVVSCRIRRFLGVKWTKWVFTEIKVRIFEFAVMSYSTQRLIVHVEDVLEEIVAKYVVNIVYDRSMSVVSSDISYRNFICAVTKIGFVARNPDFERVSGF